MSRKSEILFLDPCVSDLSVLPAAARADVETIVLDSSRPVARQMAEALCGRRRLAAIHVIAHGAPGQVSFAGGDWSLATLTRDAEPLSAIGAALAAGGDLRLWSCETAKGEAGEAFVLALAEATGAEVAAATSRIGAAALGGTWRLPAGAAPPLTAAGQRDYPGVLATKTWTGAAGSNSTSWATAANWSPSGVPAATDDIVIATVSRGRSEPTISSSTDTNISSLTVNSGATLTFSGAYTLTLNGSGTSKGLTNNGTITLGTGVISVTSVAANITNSGTITLAGGSLVNSTSGGLTNTGTISGSGTLSAPISGSGGKITASGGALDLTGTVASGQTFAISTSTVSVLEFTNTATSASAISISSANQTLLIGAGGALTINAAESITNGKITLAGGTLTDSAGVTIGSGATLSGYGAAGAIKLSGGTITQSTNALTLASIAGSGTVNGTITNAAISAASGTLTLAGSITGTSTLAISSSAASTLSITGAISSGAIAISSSNQTLNIGSTGSLTLTAAESITNGKITLGGGTLTDASGLTIGAGATLSGYGTVAANIAAGTGKITATGGALTLNGTVASGPVFSITSTSASSLVFNNTATSAAAIAISSANQTLTIGAGGNLTIAAAESITSGKITLAGGTLTVSSNLTIGTGATLSGFGTVAANIAAGSGTITASGGTLNLAGAVASGNGFTIATASASSLQFSNTATAKAPIAISNVNQTLSIGASGALTINGGAESVTNGRILLAGGTLTDTAGVTLGAGAITGFGKISAGLSASGAASVTATGGTLEVAGVIANSGALSLTVGSGATDRLLLDASGAATSATFSGTTGTLEINTSGALTLTNALAIGANTLELDGASSTLTDSAGVTLAGGLISGAGGVAANTNLSGYGTVGAPLSAADTITASSGTLQFTGEVDASAAASFRIANVAGSVLKFDGAVGTSAINPTIVFEGGQGLLDLSTLSGGLANFHATVSGFAEGEGIDIAGAASASLNGTSSTLTVYNSSGDSLGVIALGSSYAGDIFNVANGVIGVDDTAPTVSIAPIDGNDIINAAEAAAGIVISGATANVENGQIATIAILNSANVAVDTFTAAVANNAWSVNVTAAQAQALTDGGYTVTANVSDLAGVAAPQASQPITVDETSSGSTAPAHVVILSLENEGFGDVIGNAAAPYLNQLATEGMLFTNYDALAHPSQPNYLALFSGSMQGVTDDNIPSGLTAPTLASELAAAGLTFTGYAETGADPDHTPWDDFVNSVADAANFSSFPTTTAGFAKLSTVSMVTPTDDDDMTPLSDGGGGIPAGDAWLEKNLSAYAAWAMNNNSELIITFDENDDEVGTTYPNQIATIVIGAGVPAGVQNSQAGNQYALLSTIENMYGLSPLGESATTPVLDFTSATPSTAASTFADLPPGLTDYYNYPPENALAVGPGWVVASETSNIQWTNRSTNATTTESLYTLFADVPNFASVNSFLDTRLAYDSAAALYVLTAVVYYTNSSEIDVDIATSTNPSLGWNVANLVTGSTSTDMPGLAVDGDDIYVTSQIVGGSDTFVVPLSTVVNGATLSTSTSGVSSTQNLNNGNFHAVAGSAGYTYLIASWSNGSHTDLSFQTYDEATKTYSATQTVAFANADIGNGGNDYAASQAGSSDQLDAGSGNIAGLAYASIDGRSYVYGVSQVNPGAGAQPEFEWFQLDVTNATDGVTPPVLVQGGDISPASLGFSSDVGIFNPSVAVNAAGDVLINFTASGTSMDPSDYYIVAGANDSFGAPTLYQASNAPLVSPLYDGLVRWGAYSSAVADPNNPDGFWISNEYVQTSIANDYGEPAWWSTVTSDVTVSAPSGALETSAAAATNQAATSLGIASH